VISRLLSLIGDHATVYHWVLFVLFIFWHSWIQIKDLLLHETDVDWSPKITLQTSWTTDYRRAFAEHRPLYQATSGSLSGLFPKVNEDFLAKRYTHTCGKKFRETNTDSSRTSINIDTLMSLARRCSLSECTAYSPLSCPVTSVHKLLKSIKIWQLK